MVESLNRTVVVVGAGHAAGELATGLRQGGFAGPVVMIGEEEYLPYQRPPLSKGFLAGETDIASLSLRPPATYERAAIDIVAGRRVTGLDRAAKTVTLDDGRQLAYGALALATGGRARRLTVPGAAAAEAAGTLHYLRTIGDVLQLRDRFRNARRLVIVGGGYVGLEVASVAVKHGLAVTVLEGAPRVLARVTAPAVSAFYERVHRDAGVVIRTGVTVSELVSEPAPAPSGAVTAVRCTDGSAEPADLVIAGIGLEPNVELAEMAGLAVDNGIVVDEFARTSDPDIVAAGDCTNHPNGLLGRRLRLESVPNAVEQARTAAATLCGQRRPYASIPWFWSDQYDLKLQTVGLSQGYDQAVIRGDTQGRSFTAFYLQGGTLIAADCINRPQDFVIGRRLIERRAAPDAAQLADSAIPLKTLLTETAA